MERCIKRVDPKSKIQIMQVYQGLLEVAPLTSWSKLWIENCLEEKMEEDLDHAMCRFLEEATHRESLYELL
jgi:hypothetical protein